MRTVSLILTVLFAVLSPPTAFVAFAAAPVLNHLFPAGGQQGQTVHVTADGSFPVWPVSTWSDSTDITVQAAEEKGQLVIKIAESAIPGPHWIRLFDRQGGTRSRPFFVDSAAELSESEATSNVIDLSEPKIVNGVLSANNEVDSFLITLQPGEMIVASLMAHRLGSPMDAVMQLYDMDNKVVLAQVDDAPGRDPRIVFPDENAPVTIRHSSNLAIRLFAFPETPNSRIGFTGATNFVYRLTMSKTGFVDYATPLSITRSSMDDLRLIGWLLPDNDVRRAARLTGNLETVTVFQNNVPGSFRIPLLPAASRREESDCSRDAPLDCGANCVITGQLDRPGDADAFRFAGQPEEQIRLTVAGRKLGFQTDPLLEIYETSGKRLHKTDDSDGLDCVLDFKPPAAGDYIAVVRDLYGNGGTRYVYRFALNRLEPAYRLEVDKERHGFESGTDYKLAVKVLREHGFDDDVHLVAVGLPESVAVTAATSKSSGDSAKQVELVFRSTAASSAPFQIVGTTRKSPRAVRAETPATVRPHRQTDLWLTVIEPEPPSAETGK